MRNSALGFLLAVVGALLAHAGEEPSERELTWNAGVASSVITPDHPVPMWGYPGSRKDRPPEATEQDLFAKALAIEDQDGNRVVILTLDLIGVTRDLRIAVVEGVLKEHRLPPGGLLMNASHTHCGPNYEHAESRNYCDWLKRTLVDLVGRSLDDLQPASLAYSHARCGFAMNRRFPRESEVINHSNPDGPVDHSVPVLGVTGAGGQLRAVVFGYACHNTTMSFLRLMGDYAGFAQEYFEEDHPEVTALFMIGCGADQNPYPRSELKYAKIHGRSLATAVEAALETNEKVLYRQRPLRGPLRCEQESVRLEPNTSPPRCSSPFPVHVVRFGNDLSIVGLGGEPVVDYSLRLKHELSEPGGPAIWVAGYTTHSVSYIGSKRVLEEGGYEGRNTPWKPTLEERIVGKVHELHKRLTTTVVEQ